MFVTVRGIVGEGSEAPPSGDHDRRPPQASRPLGPGDARPPASPSVPPGPGAWERGAAARAPEPREPRRAVASGQWTGIPPSVPILGPGIVPDKPLYTEYVGSTAAVLPRFPSARGTQLEPRFDRDAVLSRLRHGLAVSFTANGRVVAPSSARAYSLAVSIYDLPNSAAYGRTRRGREARGGSRPGPAGTLGSEAQAAAPGPAEPSPLPGLAGYPLLSPLPINMVQEAQTRRDLERFRSLIASSFFRSQRQLPEELRLLPASCIPREATALTLADALPGEREGSCLPAKSNHTVDFVRALASSSCCVNPGFPAAPGVAQAVYAKKMDPQGAPLMYHAVTLFQLVSVLFSVDPSLSGPVDLPISPGGHAKCEPDYLHEILAAANPLDLSTLRMSLGGVLTGGREGGEGQANRDIHEGGETLDLGATRPAMIALQGGASLLSSEGSVGVEQAVSGAPSAGTLAAQPRRRQTLSVPAQEIIARQASLREWFWRICSQGETVRRAMAVFHSCVGRSEGDAEGFLGAGGEGRDAGARGLTRRGLLGDHSPGSASGQAGVRAGTQFTAPSKQRSSEHANERANAQADIHSPRRFSAAEVSLAVATFLLFGRFEEAGRILESRGLMRLAMIACQGYTAKNRALLAEVMGTMGSAGSRRPDRIDRADRGSDLGLLQAEAAASDLDIHLILSALGGGVEPVLKKQPDILANWFELLACCLSISTTTVQEGLTLFEHVVGSERQRQRELGRSAASAPQKHVSTQGLERSIVYKLIRLYAYGEAGAPSPLGSSRVFGVSGPSRDRGETGSAGDGPFEDFQDEPERVQNCVLDCGIVHPSPVVSFLLYVALFGLGFGSKNSVRRQAILSRLAILSAEFAMACDCPEFACIALQVSPVPHQNAVTRDFLHSAPQVQYLLDILLRIFQARDPGTVVAYADSYMKEQLVGDEMRGMVLLYVENAFCPPADRRMGAEAIDPLDYL